MPSDMEALTRALLLLVDRCPRLVQACYWAETSSIALEELHHRKSFDLDFHTRRALQDVRPFLAELQRAFGDRFELIQSPDEFGSGFRGVLVVDAGERVAVEVLSNYEDVPPTDLVESSIATGLRRVSLRRYLEDKIQCVAERSEARDLVDIDATLTRHPELIREARRHVAEQDALLLAERLLLWTDEAIEGDLRAYPEVDSSSARRARDLLGSWLRDSEATA